MTQPILIIMAAGMGSRFGGLKQMEPVGENGEIILDYSLYDAYQAGFRKACFVIKEENEAVFREKFEGKLPEDFILSFAHQSLSDLPEGAEIPEGRTKPWGTAHAVYAARKEITGPFVVINADDYYGKSAFQKLYTYLTQEENSHAMAAYRLENTLSKNGSVSRGICTGEDFLQSITEHTQIVPKDGGGMSGDIFFPGDTKVSMNFWGFQESFLQDLKETLLAFFQDLSGDPLKKECYLPAAVLHSMKKGKKVRMHTTDDTWMGITYREDLEEVKKGFQKLRENGEYPPSLW